VRLDDRGRSSVFSQSAVLAKVSRLSTAEARSVSHELFSFSRVKLSQWRRLLRSGLIVGVVTSGHWTDWRLSSLQERCRHCCLGVLHRVRDRCQVPVHVQFELRREKHSHLAFAYLSFAITSGVDANVTPLNWVLFPVVSG
jgi:hypothetical protein